MPKKENKMTKINNINNHAWVCTERIIGIIAHDEYLHVYNKDEIPDKENIALICIHNPEGFMHPAHKVEGFSDVLQIAFWDVEENDPAHEPITSAEAKDLYDFITKNHMKRFLIHCSAGVSRSAGVGKSIECLLDFGNTYNYSISNSEINAHKRYSPNMTVYDTIVKFRVNPTHSTARSVSFD